MESLGSTITGLYTYNDFPASVLMLAIVAGLYFLTSLRSNASGRKHDGMYGLDHGKLNIVAKPTTMWMNIGLWKNTTDFPTACRDLLVEVLDQAGLVERFGDDSGVRPAPGAGNINILDLGFGCGDQTLCMAEIWHGNPFHYVGLTLNHTQYRFAQDRLSEASVWDAKAMRVYCANAARPETWSEKIMTDVLSLRKPASRHQAGNGEWNTNVATSRTWVLALDTLYHFTPSRLPVLGFAARELQASLMAFDFLRADNTSCHQRILLRLVALISGCPRTAFMTESEYRKMLTDAGYGSDVEIEDVTEHTFQPLCSFMSKQEDDLKRIGLSLGKLKAGKWLFTWFARSKVVRAVIVVARCPGANS